MADGKLTRSEKDQLSRWLGYSADFTLVFKATRDGITYPQTQPRGPTLIIGWNTDGCSFGGFTSQDITLCPCGQGYDLSMFDNKAFLFRLSYMKKPKPQKFAVKNPAGAVVLRRASFPRFGTDLSVIPNKKNTVANGTFTFTSNTTSANFQFGTNYNNMGLTLKDVTNDNYTFTEIEMYQVADSEKSVKPWREYKCDVKVLKKFVTDYCPIEEAGVKQARILLVGSVGAGKSSFFNTINSIFRGHVSSQASAGSAEHSLTTNFRSYQIRNGSSFLKFRLCDTRGIEDTNGIDAGDIAAILDGNMPDKYMFNPFASITEDTKGYIKSTTLDNKIHCMAYVIDASSIDVMTESLLSTFKQFQKLANHRGIPQVILLTKVDQVALEVEENLSELVYSSQVAYVVDQVAQLIGLPRGHVLPTKNYECETELNEDVNKFSLLALQKMLRFADDFMYSIVDS